MQIHHVCWSHPTFCWFNRNFHTWNVSHHFWHFRSTGLKLAICFLSCGWQCLLGSIFNRGCDRDMDSSKSLPHHWRVLNGLYMDIFGTFSYITRDNPIFFHIFPHYPILYPISPYFSHIFSIFVAKKMAVFPPFVGRSRWLFLPTGHPASCASWAASCSGAGVSVTMFLLDVLHEIDINHIDYINPFYFF